MSIKRSKMILVSLSVYIIVLLIIAVFNYIVFLRESNHICLANINESIIRLNLETDALEKKMTGTLKKVRVSAANKDLRERTYPTGNRGFLTKDGKDTLVSPR